MQPIYSSDTAGYCKTSVEVEARAVKGMYTALCAIRPLTRKCRKVHTRPLLNHVSCDTEGHPLLGVPLSNFENRCL